MRHSEVGDVVRHKWGYRDTEFVIHPNGSISLSGDRYGLSGIMLPDLVRFTSDTLGVEIDPFDIQQESPNEIEPPRIHQAFLDALRAEFAESQYSLDDEERLVHSHGQTSVDEVYRVLYDSLKKVVDLVFYCQSQEDVVRIVALATEHNICLVPRGGGTSVSNALQLPEHESRMIVSVNLQRMNRILWVDEENMVACVESGILGASLERQLGQRGFTMGHEPDSIEFSSLGGWIATNASGMKQNRYGNIEDIVLGMTLVTPTGIIEETKVFGRLSSGMRFSKSLFGNEGNIGIVTKASIRIRRKPEVRKYQSLVFRDFETGVEFLKEMSDTMSPPASIRLMDNKQVDFAFAFKPESSLTGKLKHRFIEFFITAIHKFDEHKYSSTTILMEGERHEVKDHDRRLRKLAKKYGAIVGGGKNGQRGYDLTFAVAYIRELYSKWYIMGETFETTVPWNKIVSLYDAVIQHAHDMHAARQLPGKPLICGRVTQVYPTEVCVYFTYAIYTKGLANPIETFAEVEHSMRDIILEQGGSISHHHGIGKIRQRWMKDLSNRETTSTLQAIKKRLDPTNVFGIRNNVFE